MKKLFLLFIVLDLIPFFAGASTTNGTIITPYAWGDNVGWVNFAPANGNIQITDLTISGYAWDSVFGWLNLSPNSGGVTNDGQGNLSGSAWSQNAGWVNFNGVKIGLNGKFTGIASGTSYGQLSFDCDSCNVTTDWRKRDSDEKPFALSSYPTPGLYNSSQSVTLSATGSNIIRYSTDKTPADCNSGNLYSSPIIVSSSKTIFVRACNDIGNSSIASFNYFIDTTPPLPPTVSPKAGTYNSTQSVKLDASGSDYIQYSTTSMPSNCFEGTTYISDQKLTISSSKTIFVRACDLAGNSSTMSFSYVISGSIITGYYLPNLQQDKNQPNKKIFTQTLKMGVTNTEVKELQKYLNSIGFTIAKTGKGSLGNETSYFGPATRIALMKYQKANRLTSDGIMGSRTRELIIQSLNKDNSTTTTSLTTQNNLKITKVLKQGMYNNEVKELQKFLNKHGFYISKTGLGSLGNETNYFGVKTKQALISFQKSHKLFPDGMVGPKTRMVINSMK